MKAMPTDPPASLKRRAKQILEVAYRLFRREPRAVTSDALIEAMAAWRHANAMADPQTRRDLVVATCSHINEAEHKARLAHICVYPEEPKP